MAWRDHDRFSSGTKYVLFNVTQSVGWYSARTGAPAANRLDDMMLVAYFLQYFFRYGNSGFNFKTPLPAPSELDTIPLPGLIPEMLKADRKSTISDLSYWIKRYQQIEKQIICDGRVDLGLNLTYTIYTMNDTYAIIMKRGFGIDDWEDFMLNDNPTLMPVLLKTALEYDPEAV